MKITEAEDAAQAPVGARLVDAVLLGNLTAEQAAVDADGEVPGELLQEVLGEHV